jgi:porin
VARRETGSGAVRRLTTRRRVVALAGVGVAVAFPGGRLAQAADFGASWTGDFAAVLDGGLQSGTRSSGLVELTFDHVWQVRAREVALHLSAQHVYGGGLSERWVGDLQTVSNIDAEDGTRVLQAWADLPLTQSLSLKFGRYDLNSEFDVIESGGLFLNSAQGVGTDIAQTGAAGPSIFPRTSLGLRLQYRGGDDERGVWRAVALDVESDPDGEYSDTPFEGGTMFALEYERAGEATVWKGGAWSYSRTRSNHDEDERALEYGAYGSLEHRLGERWSAYARVGLANADAARIGRYVGAGLVNRDGWLRGHEDAIGLALAHARNGDAYRDAMRAEGLATDAAETALELTWRVPLGEHLVLQPDLQYVIDPGTDPAIDDAVVFILRVELTL